MDSRRDFTPKKVFPGYFSELSEKANSGLGQRLDLVEKPHLFVVFVIEKVLKHILLSPKQSEIHKKSILET